MKTLLELMDEEYRKANLRLPYKSIMDFLTDEHKSSEFIRKITHDDSFPDIDEDNELFQLSQTRARHSAITYLIGLVFADFADLRIQIIKKLKKDKNMNFLYLWMITSLYHDWGYFSDNLKNRDLEYRKTYKYYLFDNNYEDKRLSVLNNFAEKNPDAFCYTYEEILAYDKYARRFHDKRDIENRKKGYSKEIERIDHGILGGVATFNDLTKKALKNDLIVLPSVLNAIKYSCITIAQHNIYKSDSSEKDKEYGDMLKRLHSNSSHIVDNTTPLLLFLCLIDTIECVKRFSKSENKNDNTRKKTTKVESSYLYTKTVLSKIKAEVTKTTIVLDYSELFSEIEIRHQPLIKVFDQYYKDLCSFSYWTSFSVSHNDNYYVSIRNKSTESYISEAI